MNFKHIIPTLIMSCCLSLSQPQSSFADDTSAGDVAKGEKLFKSVCLHCHQVTGEQSRIGAPSLLNVLSRHDEAWINQWIKSPEALVLTDHKAMEISKSNQHGLIMPTLPVMQDEKNRRDVIAYLKTLK